MYKLIINLKCYDESMDKGAIKIARAAKSLEKQAKKKNVEIILCPQYFDIKDCLDKKVSVYSQHIDTQEPGAYTGHIVAKNLKNLNVKGTLISHSERILPLNEIKKRIKASKDANLVSVVCARNVKVVKDIAKLKPDYIAVEPKELIGGDISISTANPKLIQNSVDAANNIPLLAGAGVKNARDVKIALKLGAKGLILASGVAKAKDPKLAIKKLLNGFY